MTSDGGATKRGRRKKLKRRTHKVSSAQFQHKQISDVIPLLISTTSAAHSFLLHHDLHLLPSQSLSFETLLSSTSRSLSHLISLLSISIPTAPPPPPPQDTFFNRFLSFTPDSDPRWVEFFNISKPSFTLLLRLLTPSLTSSLPSVPPNTALAVTLFRLSHAASFSGVSRRFSLDPSMACQAFYATCKAITENIGHLFELNSDVNRIVVGFGWISLRNCCGVLGIERFVLDSENGFLLAQALVDSEGRFLDVSAGWPGNMKPQDVLKKSKLFSGIEDSKEYLNGPSFELNVGNSIPQYVIGDSYYPNLPWLLTPFRETNRELSYSEIAFNEVHCRGMELVKTAFLRLKKIWKLLGKKWKEQCTEAFPFVLIACCLLHNFLIKCSEAMLDENLERSMDSEFSVFDGEDDESGMRIRDALASHLSRVS